MLVTDLSTAFTILQKVEIEQSLYVVSVFAQTKT